MATYGQLSSQQRDAIHKALPRLYKFALVLTANEELARGLLRGTFKAMHMRAASGGTRIPAALRSHSAACMRSGRRKWPKSTAFKEMPARSAPFRGRFHQGTAGRKPTIRQVHCQSAARRKGVCSISYTEKAPPTTKRPKSPRLICFPHEAACARPSRADALARSARACRKMESGLDLNPYLSESGRHDTSQR